MPLLVFCIAVYINCSKIVTTRSVWTSWCQHVESQLNKLGFPISRAELQRCFTSSAFIAYSCARAALLELRLTVWLVIPKGRDSCVSSFLGYGTYRSIVLLLLIFPILRRAESFSNNCGLSYTWLGCALQDRLPGQLQSTRGGFSQYTKARYGVLASWLSLLEKIITLVDYKLG